MTNGRSDEGWSYWVLKILNPGVDDLEGMLNRAGADGWEVVTSVSTNKVIGAFGNHLVFVLKKPGAGHAPPVPAEPTTPGWYVVPSGDRRWWDGTRWSKAPKGA